MSIKRKFIKLDTCKIGYDNKPKEIKTELIMLYDIGRLIEVCNGIVRINNVKSEFVCNTVCSIDEVLEKCKNPIEFII